MMATGGPARSQGEVIALILAVSSWLPVPSPIGQAQKKEQRILNCRQLRIDIAGEGEAHCRCTWPNTKEEIRKEIKSIYRR